MFFFYFCIDGTEQAVCPQRENQEYLCAWSRRRSLDGAVFCCAFRVYGAFPVGLFCRIGRYVNDTWCAFPIVLFFEAHSSLCSWDDSVLQGITTFACGALIFGFASFVYLKWIDPGFIRSMLEMAVGYYQDLPDSDGQYAMMADDLSIILKNNAVPSAPAIVIAWMWLIVFSGSLLSMLVAAVVKMRKVPSRR